MFVLILRIKNNYLTLTSNIHKSLKHDNPSTFYTMCIMTINLTTKQLTTWGFLDHNDLN